MDNRVSHHPMAVVTRRTGLPADVIRAWERRYQAVTPDRSEGNHRLYSDDDIRRLLLLRRALECGWQIRQVATLPDEEIEAMLEGINAVDIPVSRHGRRRGSLEPYLGDCLERLRELDGDGLRRMIEIATVEVGRVQVLEGLLAPLMERIGLACADGSLRIAHEHLASAAIRSFLDGMQGAFPVSETAPAVVVTTPASQHHELSAMLVAATARSEGWRTSYMGPNLPAEEIAAACTAPGVGILALSISYDSNDAALDKELRRIGRLVRKDVGIVVGGRAARGYLAALNEIGATLIPDLSGFREYLRNQRGRA